MKKSIIMLIALIVFSAAGFYYGYEKEKPNVGSVVQNSQYNYTQLTGPIATTTVVAAEMLTLGSVIVTETQAGAVVVWDATSSAAITDGTYATRVADIKSAIGEGTYTFDTGLTYGLVLVSDDGFSFAGDWTVTWRRGW